MIQRKCKNCQKEFKVFPCVIRVGNGIYCSKSCSIKGTGFGKTPWNRGIKHMADSDHPAWKGDNVSYNSLHFWVRRKLGKPQKCIRCGKSWGRLHWASISHEAKRDQNDYMPMCARCHKFYDLNRRGVVSFGTI